LTKQVKWQAILPKPLKTKAILDALVDEMHTIAGEIEDDFDSTIRTWTHKPEFINQFQQDKDRTAFQVATNDEIYRYVNDGTRAHLIKPKRRRFLRFQGHYTAKTQPGVIGSNAGGASGTIMFSRGVKHPGTKGREFASAMQKKWQSPFKQRMKKAMGVAAKVSGHPA
jgi:hypothetical protein